MARKTKQMIIDELEEKVQELINENIHLKEMYEKDTNLLKKEIQKLKNEKIEKHNSRGAGRKQRFTQQEKETIKMYRIQGETIKNIANMFKCSTGLIHKLINEE